MGRALRQPQNFSDASLHLSCILSGWERDDPSVGRSGKFLHMSGLGRSDFGSASIPEFTWTPEYPVETDPSLRGLLMNRALMLAIVGALVFTVFVAFIGFGMNPLLRVTLIAGAVTGIVWLTWRDARHEKSQPAHVVEDTDERFRELRSLTEAPGFELIVAAPTQITLAVVPILMGGALLWWGMLSEPILGLVSGALFLCLGALGFLRVVPEMGAPVLSISRAGFKTPLTPAIPWDLVEGIHLNRHAPYGGVVIASLVIRVTTLAQHVSKFGLYSRLLYWLYMKEGKERLTVMLTHTNEQPDVVYRLMRLLWTQNTGRDFDWNPFPSAQYDSATLPPVGMPALAKAQLEIAGGTHVARATDKDRPARTRRTAIRKRRVRNRLRPVNQIRLAMIGLAILFILVHLGARIG